MKLDWLDDGSLLILLPEPLLNKWHGIDSDDYDRVCASADSWLSLVQIHERQGLLFGGDPGMALITSHPDGSIVIIRWIFADDEQELVTFALSDKSPTETEADLIFNNLSPL